jgi:hypothetical protein
MFGQEQAQDATVTTMTAPDATRPRSRRRLRIVLVALAVAILAFVAVRLLRPSCDEARLQAAVAALAGLPYPQHPGHTAREIVESCPAPDSEDLRSHLVFLIELQNERPKIYPGSRDDPYFPALWREVCPHGPDLAEINERWKPARRTLHTTCELDRLGVLTPDEGRMVAPYTIRTWTLHPWLLHHGVSAETTRQLMRAMLMWYGWSQFKYLPPDLPLPRATGVPPLPPEQDEHLFFHRGILRRMTSSLDVFEMNDPTWPDKFAVSVAGGDADRVFNLFAEASLPGEALLQVTAAVNDADDHIQLIVETGEPYQPYAALPIVLARDSAADTVAVPRGSTVGDLAPRIAARLPCCGALAPAKCPQDCAPVRLAPVGFALP